MSLIPRVVVRRWLETLLALFSLAVLYVNQHREAMPRALDLKDDTNLSLLDWLFRGVVFGMMGILGFSALVVVGDNHGHAGFGMGKAREVPMAIKKGIEQAKKNLIKLNLKGSTIPHQVLGRYGSAQVLLKPASEGTGVIAGGPVRKVMQVAGITNVLTKSIGTSNPHNVVKATFAALLGLKDAAHVAETRSKTVEEISGRPPKEKAAVSENN